MASRIASLRAAAGVVGVTPATVRTWIDKGWLPNDAPWTPTQVRRAADRSRQTGGRGTLAAHGTPSRWRSGCGCAECSAAHLTALRTLRGKRRTAEWSARGPKLLALIGEGVELSVAAQDLDTTIQAVNAHRRRDPVFSARLDAELMAQRDPRLPHGTARAWRARCRCPECRAYHESSR